MKQEVKEAFRQAIKMQEDYQNELFSMGREFTEFLKQHPEEMAIVLVGRPYNSFTETSK